MKTSRRHRHLLTLPRGDGKVFLSWRLLTDDAPDLSFHVERRRHGREWERVSAPVVDSTTFLDQVPEAMIYTYRIVSADGTLSEMVDADAGAPPTIATVDRSLHPDDERFQGLIVGDLTNDGRLGYVVRSARGSAVWLTAYRHDGEWLWEIDTCLPARGGWNGSMHHVPFLCWDLDGDGRSEVAFHSFKGSYPTADYDLAVDGEHLKVVDGETGETRWEAPWPAVKSRVMMTVGHLSGLDRPASVVVLDETYGDVTLTAIDGKTGGTAWRIAQTRPAGHNLDIADVDGDGVQEVICGGVCYRGDGRIRWEAEPFGHTDISKPAKIVPDLPGLQTWYAVESRNPGVYLVDRDGQTLFKEPFRHAHYGWIARHAPGVPGLHPHTAEDARRADRRESGHFPIFLPDGTHWVDLTDWQRKNLVPVHWDEGPEVVFAIRKENKRLVCLKKTGTAEIEDLPGGKLPEGGAYARNLACVDVVGDFRENIVTVDEDRRRLLVLANPNVAHRRGHSPWDHFAYRHDRSQLGSGYYIYLSPPETCV